MVERDHRSDRLEEAHTRAQGLEKKDVGSLARSVVLHPVLEGSWVFRASRFRLRGSEEAADEKPRICILCGVAQEEALFGLLGLRVWVFKLY